SACYGEFLSCLVSGITFTFPGGGANNRFQPRDATATAPRTRTDYPISGATAHARRLPCVFLFQPEDGIRYRNVTGVQTCALPIWWRTPMLVIHGEQDFRIPYSQGIAAFTALQRRGIESLLVVFPEENHWVLKPADSVLWYH